MDNRKHKVAGIIDIPKHVDTFGTIHIADMNFPFEVKRVLWIYNIRDGRGEKAQRECEHVYVMLRGRIVVETFSSHWQTFLLDSPEKGLYLPKMTWRTIKFPTDDAVLLVLCSHHYDPKDRIADFGEFSLEAGYEVP